MATKLAQLVAIETGVKSNLSKVITELYHKLQKAALFAGLTRSYTPHGDEGEQLHGEGTHVQQNVDDVLAAAAAAWIRLLDVGASKNQTNTQARATVTLEADGLRLPDLPVPTLLLLEKQLLDVRTLVMSMPLLDPAEVWSTDTTTGLWRNEPTKTMRSKKIPRNHVKAVATDKHPAQVEVYFEDTWVGTWTTTKLSGAMPAERQRVLLARVDALVEAVRKARAAANETPVTDVAIGEQIFGYLFA